MAEPSTPPSGEEPADQSQLRILVDSLPDGVIIHYAGRIAFANRTALQMLGTSEVIGHNLYDLFHPGSRESLKELNHTPPPPDNLPTFAELKLLRTTGEPLEVEVVARTILLKGKPAVINIITDATQRRQRVKEIIQQANYDPLTKLPNRALFMERLGHELVRARRQRSCVALMFIDLDRFKWVNDTLGHAAGDELLRETATRLLNLHRKSDTVARLGGDEFTVILPDIARAPDAERIARAILEQLALPYHLEGQEVFISGSVGVTIFPDDAPNVDELLRNADSAMYRAKNSGRNAYCFYTPDLHAEAVARLALEKDLRKAIAHNDLEVYYQPIITCDSHQLVGAECFLRWTSDTRGAVPPNVFITMAEEIGLLSQITEQTLATVCRQASHWRAQLNNEFFVSVNLSCIRCRDLTVDLTVERILAETGLPSEALILEVNENILIDNETKALAMLRRLKGLGVKLWLDDFGTGLSSLSFLRKLPVDGLKIDRMFISDLANDEEVRFMVDAIISLAESLNRIVVAEGVENLYQEGYLFDRGCRLAQGYLYSRPVEREEFQTLVNFYCNQQAR